MLHNSPPKCFTDSAKDFATHDLTNDATTAVAYAIAMQHVALALRDTPKRYERIIQHLYSFASSI
jgi:hypothetical protein